MGCAASVVSDSTPAQPLYRYGETWGGKVSEGGGAVSPPMAASWIGKELDLPLKPFSLETYFEVLDIVGTGMLGKVRVIRHKRTSLYYAIKSIKKKDVLDRKMTGHLEAERDVMEKMSEIRHPFAVQYFGSFTTTSHVHFLMEYVPGGELFHRLTTVGRFLNDEAKFYATELVVFIEACHAHGFMYRDLKPENILLDAGGHIRVVDFGFIKWLRKPNDRTSSSVGTPQYLAPEQLTLSNKARSYSRVVDWWAFACVLYEMVNGSPPFTTNQDGGDSHYALYTRILSGKIYWPRHLQAPLKDLLRQMLLPDPAKRLSNVESIKKHAWFEGVDWTIVPLCQVVAPHPPTLSCAGDTDNFDDYPSSTEETLPLDDDMNRYDFCTF